MRLEVDTAARCYIVHYVAIFQPELSLRLSSAFTTERANALDDYYGLLVDAALTK